jgi:hypothetical protein
MTSEGKVKEAVKACLARNGILPASKAGNFDETARGWYYLPVSNGMGTHGIPDLIGHCEGRFFAVETKAPGRKPTGFQALQIAAIRASGAAVFVVDGDCSELEAWLKTPSPTCLRCDIGVPYAPCTCAKGRA